MDIPNLIEKNKVKNRRIPLLNILFILLLISGSILVGFFLGRGQKKDFGDILGEEKKMSLQENKDLIPSPGFVLRTMTSGAEKTMQETIKRFTTVITDTASKSAENISNVLFDSTVGTVLKQINNLPQKVIKAIKP